MRDKQSPRVVEFIEKISVVCMEFGFSISHEDGYGAFIVTGYNKTDDDWIREAFDHTDVGGDDAAKP